MRWIDSIEYGGRKPIGEGGETEPITFRVWGDWRDQVGGWEGLPGSCILCRHSYPCCSRCCFLSRESFPHSCLLIKHLFCKNFIKVSILWKRLTFILMDYKRSSKISHGGPSSPEEEMEGSRNHRKSPEIFRRRSPTSPLLSKSSRRKALPRTIWWYYLVLIKL